MTQQMKRMLARVDGLPPMVAPVSILAPPKETTPQRAARGRAGRRRRRSARADWMSGRVAPEIERLVVDDPADIRRDLAAAGLM
jgi:hypothetical protein